MKYIGVGISGGKALGRAIVFGHEKIARSNNKAIKPEAEIKKVSFAITALIGEYNTIIDKGIENSEIVSLAEAYKMMISSPSLCEEIKDLIKGKKYDAVSAVEQVFNSKEKELSLLGTAYARERAVDINSIKKTIIRKMLGIKDDDWSNIDYDFILVSKEVTPSMLLSVNHKHIKGIVSEVGSKTSHVTIIAKSIGIPVVFNVEEVHRIIKNNEILYIDGSEGIIINDIDSESLKTFKEEIEKYDALCSNLKEMLEKQAKTKDHKNYEVAANVGEATDLERVININADGVGLFRTEFLYLNRDNPPSEEMQFNICRSFATALADKKVIIRTIDIGRDKKAPFIDIPPESNPFLGYRAIRYCLDNRDIFKTQLRAILRASKYGNVMIMYPLISSIDEVRNANAILREVMAELDEEAIFYNKEIKIGIMVEVPSVAVMADLFIDEVDFFSIGTNDLVQYTMAVDRTNSKVKELYDPFNPAVIRLIKKTIDSKKDGKFVGLCGEMAADPRYIIILVGLGLDEFSVNVNSVLKVKKYISLLNYEECKRIVDHILTLKTGVKVESYLDSYAKEAFNKYLDL
ncbi:MAG: phosphoenolpyruvate--protein phosphotransferase [Bacilli bacterium]|nr:phosphoenolpyruvate--protein phosphotransferase [Bacilli bacterium]